LKITVKLFAAYQEAYGKPELEMDVEPGVTVVEIGERVRAHYPSLKDLAPVTRYWINCAFVEPQQGVAEGDEIVLIPPVSGG